MKKLLLLLIAAPSIVLAEPKKDKILSIVHHRWQEIITESNHAALRPGSVYDISTYFEQNFSVKRPVFNYLFFDTGLGAADPIYPIFQSGHQRNWAQLVKASLSKENRHIDHYSESITADGCKIRSIYWVRHLNEFPDLYAKELADGYTLVDISFEHYTKLRPDAQCGKHRAYDNEDHVAEFMTIDTLADKFRTFADIPPHLLALSEAKVGLLKLVTEEFDKKKWPRYQQAFNERDNSLYFYPDAFAPDYGIRTPRTQSGLMFLNKPAQLYFEATPAMDAAFPLSGLVSAGDWQKLMNFLNGQPTPNFDPAREPGADTFRLSDVKPKHMYTHGAEHFPITDAAADVADPKHYKLVSAVIHPAEPPTGAHANQGAAGPQLRFVFQMMNPHDLKRPVEQMFLHLRYDATADVLEKLDQLTHVRENRGVLEADAATVKFLRDFTARPLQMINFSTSLTGIWAFGNLERVETGDRELTALPIVRSGINVGYYSTVYDTVLFREEAARATGDRKAELMKILDDLAPRFYRDPRRHDPESMAFNRVTCAQCHQTAGRDGTHVTLNDGIDRRVTTATRATEHMFRELDRQLRALRPSR